MVESVGDDVANVAPATSSSSTGARSAGSAARAARPALVLLGTHDAKQKMTLADEAAVAGPGYRRVRQEALVASGLRKVNRPRGPRSPACWAAA